MGAACRIPTHFRERIDGGRECDVHDRRRVPQLAHVPPEQKAKAVRLPAGRTVAGKYVIERPLGSGWEGEVYVIIERTTGIRRAAKFYYPHRDPMGKAAIA